jgi:hypothetical protein
MFGHVMFVDVWCMARRFSRSTASRSRALVVQTLVVQALVVQALVVDTYHITPHLFGSLIAKG